MLAWVCTHVPGVTNLTRDFVDGSNLVRLYESVSQTQVLFQWAPSPANLRESRENIGRIVALLENMRYIKRGSIRKDQLLWGDLRSTYAILRAINLFVAEGNLPPLPTTFARRDRPSGPPPCPQPADGAQRPRGGG
jgi:hypothetical protein